MQSGSSLVGAIVASGALAKDPMVVVDIGCGLGIDAGWRCFGEHLRAFGFDPNLDEIARLREGETHPAIRYEAGWISPPEDEASRDQRRDGSYWGRNPWDRLSVSAAMHRLTAETAAELAQQNRWNEARLADQDRRIVIRDYLSHAGVWAVDFVKLDVDGPDFEILVSMDQLLDEGPVLGLGMEVNFFGSSAPTDHTFHNTDRFLKGRGFELFGLSVRKYSMAALPAQFVYSFPAQTATGRPIQGDAVYFRDVGNPEHRRVLDNLRPAQLLKLACLFDLFELADCAAELLITTRERLEPIVPVEPLLDTLVPDPWTGTLSYREYVARFEADDPMFFP